MKQNFDNNKGKNRVNRQNKIGKNTSKTVLGRRPKTPNPVWSGEQGRGFGDGGGGLERNACRNIHEIVP